MRWSISLVVLMLLWEVPAQVAAQFLPPFRRVAVTGGGVGLTYQRRNLAVNAFVGGAAIQPIGFAPLVGPSWGCGPGWCGPWGPAWGWGVPPIVAPGFAPLPWWGQPPVVVIQATPPPLVLPPGLDRDPDLAPPPRPRPQVQDDLRFPGLEQDFLVIRPRQPPVERSRPADPEMPGRIVGGFRPVPPGAERERLQPPLAQPMPRGDLFAPRLPEGKNPDDPLPQPRQEAARLLRLAGADFRAEQYGLAAEKYRRALQLAPDLAVAYFHLAQCYFAVGRYAEAVQAIRNGLEHDPTWPISDFRVRELYADARIWTEQRMALETAIARQPDHPGWLFLLGYQLWFAGERATAKEWFQRARQRTTEPQIIDLFRQADAEMIRK